VIFIVIFNWGITLRRKVAFDARHSAPDLGRAWFRPSVLTLLLETKCGRITSSRLQPDITLSRVGGKRTTECPRCHGVGRPGPGGNGRLDGGGSTGHRAGFVPISREARRSSRGCRDLGAISFSHDHGARPRSILVETCREIRSRPRQKLPKQ